MEFIEELKEYIENWCETNNISIDLRFACLADVNKFYTHNEEFSLDCISYYANDFEDIKQFFVDYLYVIWSNCEKPMNKIALYIEDIVDMDDWYDVIVGGGLFEDEAI